MNSSKCSINIKITYPKLIFSTSIFNAHIIRIGNAKFHRELPIQNRLKGCVYNEKKISYFLNPSGWAKPLENGFIPPLDGSDGDVGVRVPEFYMCVKDTGTKYQLWISDFNIDGTFTRVHPFIISHTKTMTRTREDGKEEVFSACIKPDDTRYLECVLIMDGLNTLMLKIFFIKFKVLQVLDILIGMAKELILLNIMVNTLE